MEGFPMAFHSLLLGDREEQAIQWHNQIHLIQIHLLLEQKCSMQEIPCHHHQYLLQNTSSAH